MDSERNELVIPMEGFGEAFAMSPRDEKQNRKGLLNWFKLRVEKSDTF